MNAYMKIRRQAKISREDLAEKIGVPLKVLIDYERAGNPVPTLHFQERFKTIFNVTEADIKAVTGNG